MSIHLQSPYLHHIVLCPRRIYCSKSTRGVYVTTVANPAYVCVTAWFLGGACADGSQYLFVFNDAIKQFGRCQNFRVTIK